MLFSFKNSNSSSKQSNIIHFSCDGLIVGAGGGSIAGAGVGSIVGSVDASIVFVSD